MLLNKDKPKPISFKTIRSNTKLAGFSDTHTKVVDKKAPADIAEEPAV